MTRVLDGSAGMGRSPVEHRVALMEYAVARFNAGDYDRFVQIFSSDVAVLADPQVADRVEYRGHTGLMVWLEEARQRWRAVRFRALAVEPFGDAVVVELAVVADTAAGGG